MSECPCVKKNVPIATAAFLGADVHADVHDLNANIWVELLAPIITHLFPEMTFVTCSSMRVYSLILQLFGDV